MKKFFKVPFMELVTVLAFISTLVVLSLQSAFAVTDCCKWDITSLEIIEHWTDCERQECPENTDISCDLQWRILEIDSELWDDAGCKLRFYSCRPNCNDAYVITENLGDDPTQITDSWKEWRKCDLMRCSDDRPGIECFCDACGPVAFKSLSYETDCES